MSDDEPGVSSTATLEARPTRTSASGGPAQPGAYGETTQLTSGPRGRRIVRAVVCGTEALRATGAALSQGAAWAGRTVRPAGILVVLAATLGLGLGIVFGWVEWMVAGAVALLLFAMAVPFLFGARSYDVELILAHQRVVAGSEAAGRIVVRNDGRRVALPGRIDIPVGTGLVEFGVPLLRPGQSIGTTDRDPRAAPRHRSRRAGHDGARRPDRPAAARARVPDVHELYVHPRTIAIPSTSAGLIRDLEGNPTRRLVDADMSFHAIREYAPGDARRQIHWKSTAKTGRLMVRQYEESRRSRMAVVLSVAQAEYADADEFELAVSCAASLGLRAVHDARELDIVTGTEIPRVVRGRLRAIRRISGASRRTMLDGFSAVESVENSMPIAEVCRLTGESNDHLSIAFVVVGSTVALSSLRQAALGFPVETSVIAVMCDERAHPRMRALPGLNALTVGTLDDLAGLLLRGAAS